MERKETIVLSYVSMLLGLLALIYGFAVIVENNTDWLFNLGIFAITILVSIFILLLVMSMSKKRQEKMTGVYISYSGNDEDSALQLINSIKQRIVIQGEKDIKPGANIEKEVKRYIKESSLCFVVIGQKVSPQQKIEIKEMLRQDKQIIPVRISNEVKIPSNLRNTKSVLLSEFVVSNSKKPQKL